MLAVTGYNTTIVGELRKMAEAHVVRIDNQNFRDYAGAGRFLFAAGILQPLRGIVQTAAQIEASLRVNMLEVIEMCDYIIEVNPEARICVVGSESGCSGSQDEVYAAAKAGIHAYVERKRLCSPDQQLVAVAPSIIEDSGMTRRRTDLANLDEKRRRHPKGRFLRAVEVARLIHFLLYIDEGYTSGVVVRMNGGSHTWKP